MPYILQENQNNAWAQHGIDVETIKSQNPDRNRTPLRNHRIPTHATNGHNGHNGISPLLTMGHAGTFPNHVSSRPGSRQSNRSQTGTIGGALTATSMANVRSPLSVKDSGLHSGINSPMNTTALSMVPEDDQPTVTADQEVIEVQILPQDDNWGDNTTAVTGNTSDVGGSMEDVAMKWNPLDADAGLAFRCQRWAGFGIAVALSLTGILSPIIMVTLPKTGVLQLSPEQLRCGAECDGALLSLACKLVILAVGSWAVFLRRPRATTPRIYTLRALVLLILFVLVFAFWLFYCVRLVEETDEITLYAVVLFAVSLADSLLFVHYIAVILMEIRQQQPQYVVKVLRSPDGESRTYALGDYSIQRAAVVVLEKYYRDFSVYNPYLERIPVSKSKRSHHGSSFKFYDVDGVTSVEDPTGMSGTGTARRRESSHNERFYEESDYERRVRKRRARLLTAAEEAFTHIKRLHKDQGDGNPLGPDEAAQAVFPAVSKPLQKYLRLTRQQPWHSMESILRHLSTCVANDLSPKAFLERYLSTYSMLQFEPEKRKIQTWALVCDTLVSRGIKDGLTFQLRQNQVTLFCSLAKLPHINLMEDVMDQKSNKFVIRLNSETSV